MILLGAVKHWWETTKHKGWVAFYLFRSLLGENVADWPEIASRAVRHDLSKYRWDETRGFAKSIFKLPTLTYDSPEYRAALEAMAPSIAKHYERNRHHPEWHLRGIAGMSHLDKLEMVCDWAAAVRRHRDGNLDVSITKNRERFNYGDYREDELREMARRIGALA